MSSPKVAIVRTGLANLASVLAGLKRAGADPYVTEDPEAVYDEKFVMLPGVGAYGAAMDQLNSTGMGERLIARMNENRPTLCICLGLQLLGESSQETPGVRGLGFTQMQIRRLPDTERVPQLGWNDIVPDDGCNYLEPGYAYFANSYCAPSAPAGWNAAMATHGTSFVAAMEKGAILSCQFHPELSGKWGVKLLQRWLEKSPAQS